MNPNVKILIEALQNIQSYSHSGDGICPYGCDTPYIAKVALVDFDNAEYAPRGSVESAVFCRCENPDIAFNHNRTRWVCVFCGTKGAS